MEARLVRKDADEQMTPSAFSQQTADEASENDFVRFDKLGIDGGHEPKTKDDVQALWPTENVAPQIESNRRGTISDHDRCVDQAEQDAKSVNNLDGICFSSSTPPITPPVQRADMQMQNTHEARRSEAHGDYEYTHGDLRIGRRGSYCPSPAGLATPGNTDRPGRAGVTASKDGSVQNQSENKNAILGHALSEEANMDAPKGNTERMMNHSRTDRICVTQAEAQTTGHSCSERGEDYTEAAGVQSLISSKKTSLQSKNTVPRWPQPTSI